MSMLFVSGRAGRGEGCCFDVRHSNVVIRQPVTTKAKKVTFKTSPSSQWAARHEVLSRAFSSQLNRRDLELENPSPTKSCKEVPFIAFAPAINVVEFLALYSKPLPFGFRLASGIDPIRRL